jgi:hypothetical protein
MENGEIDQIKNLIADVHEGLCAGNNRGTMQCQLTELYQVIKRLMHETSRAKDSAIKIALASLEYAARKQKNLLEERLALTN